MNDGMKALSVQQPWAWLIVMGYKDIENRRWKTTRRGRVMIHASKKFDTDGYWWVRSEFPEIPLPEIGDYPMGGVVGEATIVDCVDRSRSEWFSGPHGFLLTEAATYSPMLPCLGKLGFFNPKWITT